MVDAIITLYECTEKAFSHNGLGSLPDAASCYVTEERNGEYELEMEYPLTGRRYTELQKRRIIFAKPNPYDDPQPFRIYAITKPLHGIVTVHAAHISYDTSDTMAMTVDLSGCVSIETVKAKGSTITGLTLPVGGKIKSLELPGTVTNFTIRDHAQLETISVDGYSALTTLRVENTPNIPYETIINNAVNLNRVRLINVAWTATSENTLQASITKLKACVGMDAAGDNTAAAVVTGRVYVPSVSAELLTEINEAFPQLVVVANGEPQYIVRYLDWNNTVLYRAVVAEGGDAVNAVTAGYISAPTREGTEDTGYAFKDFGTLPTNIHGNISVIAQYTTTYRVRFMNGDAVFDTQWVTAGSNAVTPSGTPTKSSTAQYSYTFSRWSGSYVNVTAPVDVTAVYTSTIRTYTVKFYNGTTLLQTITNVPYGGTATYTGNTPVDPDGNGAEFEGWSPSNTNIQGNTSCYAQFAPAMEEVEITDDWGTILASITAGTYKSKYKVGNYKPLDLGAEGVVNMQIAGFDKDDLADGSGKAAISWISKELLTTDKRMNPSLVTNYDESTKAAWAQDSNDIWTSQNQKAGSTSATATWVITATEAGTVTISYMVSSEQAHDKLTVKVNDETVANAISGYGSWIDYTVECGAGNTVTVNATYSKDGSGDIGLDTGYIKFASTGAFTVEPEIPNLTVKTIRDYQEGTGTIGGWEKTEMRAYMIGTIKPLIPDPVLSAIKAVKKTHTANNTAGSSITQTTTDEVWLPDHDEMFDSSCPYKALFPDSTSRRKQKVGTTSYFSWWLRSAYHPDLFHAVGDYGFSNGGSAHATFGVVLGFCT